MMQPDDPPFLTVGTEVSAKYKGAFCEAKVNKVVKIVKVKVNFKLGNGSAVLLDDAIKGVLKVGAHVKANHPDKGQQIEAIVTKIQDCSQYTVVFDDGDITTLRRSSLCLKSGRHFAESETLDQLPLTHPEHFGTPVVGGSRRGRRSRHHADSDEDTSDEENEGNVRKRHRSQRCEWESDMGKVVCVEIGDKKKLKDNWFPGLVVAPTAQDSVKIESKKDYLVRSFQDGRYYTVPKKEAIEFSRDVASKVAQSSLRTAVDKALLYIDQDDLPPHWDRDLLFGVDVSDIDSDRETDSDSSDDEPTEEKDHFVAQLYKFMEECGTPINKGPTIGTKDLDLYKLFQVVQKLGGFNRVMNQNQWKIVASKMCLQSLGTQSGSLVKAAYKRYLHNFDDFYRKLGCTMVSSPRGARARQKSGRSLIRDCDKRVSLRGGETDSAEETDKKDNDTEEDEKPQDYVEKAKKVLEEEGRRSMPRRLTPLRTMSPTLKEKPKEQLRSSRQQEIRLRNLSGKASSRESSKESVREEEPRRKAEETTKKKEVKEDGRKNRLELKRTTSAVKVESESEADEDEAKGKTRVLRNREEKEKIKEVETTKKTLERKVKQEVQPRSASCNSTSSGTSCASTGTSSSATNTSDVTKTTPKGKTPVQKCPNVIEDKRRGRKKRLDLKDEESLGKSLLPAHVPICVGDRLKVLYGPNNKESKVTYEAKVLEVEETSGQKMYYVHYNGWNTRYDEWVVRQRVAQNLTWCQNRMNKARSLSKEPVKEKQQEAEPEKKKPEKETTVAGTRANANSAKCKLPVKITRSDSTSSTRSSVRAEKPSPALTRSTSCNFDKSERRRSKRNSAVSTKEAEESGSDGSDCGPESSRQKGSMVSRSFSDTIQSKPTASSGENKESLNIKVEEGSVGKCGKDIDMKAIESEMKGLDRPAKKEELTLKETTGRVLTVIPGSLTFTEKKKHDPKKPFDSPVKRMEIPVKLVPAQEIMGQIKPMTLSDIKKESLEDDIYEFKEPEPFEFSDIRSRKDGKAKPQESPEGDVKVKRKTRPLKPDDSESDTPSTPQKRSSTFEESPSKRQDTSESTTKKDYTRKPLEGVKITPEKLIKDNQDKMNTLYNLQVKDQAGIATDKQYMYDLYSKDKTPQRMPVDVKDIKYELPDSKESHFISSSVIITPKKMATKKEPSPAKEEVIISPLKADANVEKVGLAISKPSGQSEKSDVGNRLAGTSSHVMAQVVMPPADSRILAMSSSKHAAELMKNPTLSNVLITPVKSDEKADGKLMSFSQRQQHIFPHLLNRPEHSEEKVDEINIQRISSANANAIHPFTIQQPTYEEHSPPVVSIPEDSSIPDVLPTIVSPDPDKLSDKRPDSTIGESIEAVILRARQDTAEEEKKDTSKPPDKRRRNPGRSKKTLSREFIPDTSEESDSENKSEKTDTRLKRRAGDGSKYSPSKKATRTSTDMDKKVARRCDEEERANDADEEDNEGNFSTQKLPSKEFLKRRNKMEEEGEQSPGPPAKLIKKKRLSAVSRRLDDGEETGLGDLMCEEDILPGSPMLQDNSAAETEGQTQPQTSDNQEMPFASVPTGSSFNKRTATPPTTYSSNLPLSLQQLPPSISIQSMSKSSTSSPPTPSSSVPVSTIQPHVTITSVTSPQAPVSSASVSPSSSEQPITNTPIQTPQTKMVTKAMAKQPFNAIESSPPSIPPGLPSSKDHSRMVTQHHSVPQKIDSHSSQKADSGQASHKSEQPRISPLIRPSPLLSNDHTPPTTPESMVSTLSDSPRREHEKFEDSEKGRTLYSSEMDGDSKAENYSEDSSTMDSHNLSAMKSHSHSRDMALSARVPGARMSHSEGWDTEDGIPCQPKRKKKGTKMARPVPSDEKESPVPPLGTRRRRRRHSSSRTPVRQEEELEDTHGLNALSLAAFHSSRGKIRYNFVELEPELDAESRIAVLQSRMRELKRTYTQVKSELASVERKRKKLRKKEREKENAPAEVEGN